VTLLTAAEGSVKARKGPRLCTILGTNFRESRRMSSQNFNLVNFGEFPS
jgi:hypothetical protein